MKVKNKKINNQIKKIKKIKMKIKMKKTKKIHPKNIKA